MNAEPIEFTVGKASLTVLDKVRQIFGVTIKYDGKWQIHQNDADPFPSDFHAHRQDKPETLDIYNGNVYDPRTRKHIRTIDEDDMKNVYDDLKRRDKAQLNVKLNNSGQFTYL